VEFGLNQSPSTTLNSNLVYCDSSKYKYLQTALVSSPFVLYTFVLVKVMCFLLFLSYYCEYTMKKSPVMKHCKDESDVFTRSMKRDYTMTATSHDHEGHSNENVTN